MPQKTIVKLSLCVISAFALLSCTRTNHAKAPIATQAAPVSIADDEIRDVVNRVWGYPWGVALYGLTRSTDATGDKEVESFVLNHNQICSRYYSWLTELHATVGDSPELTEILDKAKIRGLLRLGNLDSCGAMGAQMLEGILHHPDQESAEEKVVVARIADWIVNKQDRLPDGTLWRSKAMGGTVWPDDLYMSAPFLIRYAKYMGTRNTWMTPPTKLSARLRLSRIAMAFGFMATLSMRKNTRPSSGDAATDG